MEDKCVSCGAVIPEGRQVCPQCEKGPVKKANEKCCYDCVFCIPSNAPLEAGMQYICINHKGEHYIENSIDPWNKACEHFGGGVGNGK